MEVRLGRSKAIVAIARKLLVAVWHILTFEAVDRHADERSVAASFINLAYKMGVKNLPNAISAKTFARQQMDRLEIGAGMTAVPWGSKRIVLPPSKLSTEIKGERRPKQVSPACTCAAGTRVNSG